MDELKYLETYGSKSTVVTYKNSLRKFFKSVYGEGTLENLAEKYFKEERDYEDDITNFLIIINGRPPKTIRLYLSAVRTFLMENKVDLPQRFWKKLHRRVKGGTLTVDRIPSNVELRRILMHMPVHGKALYLTLASSGMRIGEALQLTFEDIDLESDPVKISIRGEYTKTGDKRIAFISGETREHFTEWLKYRDSYLQTSSKRSRYGKTTEDNRLFPLSLGTANYIWTNALGKSELNQKDVSTRRHKLHSHVLRKFFRTRMASVIPVDVTEALMGHKGYLTEVYRRHTEEDLVKFYKQGESSVMIFGGKEEIALLREEVKNKNQQLQILVNGLATENMGLKEQVKNLSNSILKIQTVQEADKESLKDLQKWREEFSKRFKKASEKS